MKRFIQNDKRWKDYGIVGGISIGDFGCLLTSITNIVNQYLGEEAYTPLTMCKRLQESGGFNERGELLWASLEKLFNLKYVEKHVYNNKPTFKDGLNDWYIIQVFYKDTGHFCEITGTKGDVISYFDSYTGKTVKTKKYITIRELKFVV